MGINVNWILDQAECTHRTVTLADNKGYRVEVIKKSNRQVMAKAVADDEQTALMEATMKLQKEMKLADGPTTPEQDMSKRISKLEADVSIIKQMLGDLGNNKPGQTGQTKK